MPTQINMAAAFGIATGFIWCLFSLASTAGASTLSAISGTDGATHLETLQPIVTGMGFSDGLVWLTIIAALIGSLLAQVNFDFNEF
ncbi:MAG: hypothetical protein ACPG06_01580 [Alphaproteobacteria bacterium]